jgi:iron complex transport system ATP-binding protein
MVLNSVSRLEFPGAALDWGNDYYLVRLEQATEFLSSAPLGEGFVEARWILSQQVKADAALQDPDLCLRQKAQQRGILQGDAFIGLLTSVSHRHLQVCSLAESGVRVTALATAGVEHGSSPLEKRISVYGESPKLPLEPAPRLGTINLVTLVAADLTPGALVRASTISTEAKTLALLEAGLKTREGFITTGTPTDVTVVGHSGRGSRFRYAGSATLVGWLVGQASYRCVKQGLAAYNEQKRQQNGPSASLDLMADEPTSS